MNQKIKPEDIDRLGNQKNSRNAKPRPVIVKYVRCNTKNKIYRNQKFLKRKRIKLKESLTAKRIKTLGKARELHGYMNVKSQVT